MNRKQTIFILVFLLILSIFMTACDNNTDSVPMEENGEKEKVDGYTVKHGELLSVIISGDNDEVAVFKVKIEPNLTNNLTIQQNGHNIEDLILNQGADKFQQIQYWAVADMKDGSQSKVISFDVNQHLIEQIKNKKIFGSEVVDHSDNLWILPSLLN